MTVFDALADPTRRRILELLRERPRMVGELVELLGISQPGVSKQLRVLRDIGLVSVRQDAQRHWYELQPGPLNALDDWLAGFRHLMQAKFDRLDDLLQRMKDEERSDE